MPKNIKQTPEYAVNLEKALIDGGHVDEFFKFRAMMQRRLYLHSEIYDNTVKNIIKSIIMFNKEDHGLKYEERSPIMLYIDSPGGSVQSGFSLIDVIESSETPVYTINEGKEYSMGFVVGLSGHKRFSYKHSTFLIHDGWLHISNSDSKARDEMVFFERLDDSIKKFIVGHSNITLEEYENRVRSEWYMFADEAKSKNIVDYIIGDDCNIHNVI